MQNLKGVHVKSTNESEPGKTNRTELNGFAPSSFHANKSINFLGSLLLTFFVFLLAEGVSASPKYTLYFYSSETNINNYSSLKAEFDLYLSTQGDYRFQPFCDRETFELFISDNQDGVFLLSSWHYQQLKERVPMEPVLVGLSKNRATQKRVLTTKKNIEN